MLCRRLLPAGKTHFPAASILLALWLQLPNLTAGLEFNLRSCVSYQREQSLRGHWTSACHVSQAREDSENTGIREPQPRVWQMSAQWEETSKMGEQGSSGLPEENISEAGMSWDQEGVRKVPGRGAPLDRLQFTGKHGGRSKWPG